MIPYRGSIDLLREILNNPTLALTVRLCKVNPVPADTAIVLADVHGANEATFAGYAALAGVAWPAPALNVSNEAESDGPTLSWTAGAVMGPETIYGSYLTYTSYDLATKLLAWTRFTSPITIAVMGQQIQKRWNFYNWQGIP